MRKGKQSSLMHSRERFFNLVPGFSSTRPYGAELKNPRNLGCDVMCKVFL